MRNERDLDNLPPKAFIDCPNWTVVQNRRDEAVMRASAVQDFVDPERVDYTAQMLSLPMAGRRSPFSM